MEAVGQEEALISADYIIKSFFFSLSLSTDVCTWLGEIDRYTPTHAKICSAVGTGVRGDVFDHLIL